MRKKLFTNRLLILMIPVAAILLAACVPLTPQFSHQGRLLDDSGEPVADGDYEVMYRIYQTETEGTAVYTDTQTVAVANGLFTTSLGLTDEIPADVFALPTWLDITVDGETLTPRQRLLGAPFAFSLVTGAVVQGAEPLERTFSGQENTGAVLTVWNNGVTETSGNALLAINQAAPTNADREKVAALQAIAAGGTNDNGPDPDTGAYGAIVLSEGYRGMYVRSAEPPGGNYFAAVFESPAGIEIIGGGSCNGCATAYNAQNVGDVPIQAGDFVAVDGVVVDAELNIPIMQVRKAATADAVVGVANGAMLRNPVGKHNGVTTGGFEASGAAAAGSGEFLSVVVQGLVQANAASGAAISAGEMVTVTDGGVTAGSAGVARALSSVDANGQVWVMVGQ